MYCFLFSKYHVKSLLYKIGLFLFISLFVNTAFLYVSLQRLAFESAIAIALTLKCIRGSFGLVILFFASPVKARKDCFPLFFDNCLTIGYASFGEKKNDVGRAIFTLISINGRYCAMSQNLFQPPSLNRIIILKSYFKNVNIFILFNFEPSFTEKIPWERGFFKFGHATFLRNENSFFDRHLWLFWVYTHARFVPKFLRKSTQK